MTDPPPPPGVPPRDGSGSGGSIQVIGIGYGSTGTQSLQEALNLLGYNTFHSTKNILLELPSFFINNNNNNLLDIWYTNTTKQISLEDYCPIDLTKLLSLSSQGEKYYTAATGSLFSVCWRKALRQFPNAYYILTIRSSPQEWWYSWNKLVRAITFLNQYAPNLPRVHYINFYHRWLVSWIHNNDKTYFSSKQQKQMNFKIATTSYQNHILEIQKIIPKHQLLILETGNGKEWEQLCGFLNISLPQQQHDYPHLGTSDSVLFQCRMVVGIGFLILMIIQFGITKLILRLFQKNKKKQQHSTTTTTTTNREEKEEVILQVVAKSEEEEERVMVETDQINQQQIMKLK